MGFVAAKCTQCGANIEVDESKEAGVCKYCGTAFVTEKAINNYNTYTTNDYDGATINILNAINIEDLLELAQMAEAAGNWEEANQYYTRALEQAPNNKKALLGKGCMECLESNIYDIRYDKLFIYVKKSLENCDEEDFIRCALVELKRVRNIIYNSLVNKYNKLWEDEESFSMLTDGVIACLNITLYEVDYIQEKKMELKCIDEYKEILESGMTYCVEICKQRNFASINDLGERCINSIKISAPRHPEYLRIFDRLCGISKDISAKTGERIEISEINRNSELESTEGCYIATCIYGSYDCPQVWTLRRFRDWYLYKRRWGREFIMFYYKLSPKLVSRMGNKQSFCAAWKIFLNLMVRVLNKRGYNSNYYKDFR